MGLDRQVASAPADLLLLKGVPSAGAQDLVRLVGDPVVDRAVTLEGVVLADQPVAEQGLGKDRVPEALSGDSERLVPEVHGSERAVVLEEGLERLDPVQLGQEDSEKHQLVC